MTVSYETPCLADLYKHAHCRFTQSLKSEKSSVSSSQLKGFELEIASFHLTPLNISPMAVSKKHCRKAENSNSCKKTKWEPHQCDSDLAWICNNAGIWHLLRESE